jgi:hypothetical protein
MITDYEKTKGLATWVNPSLGDIIRMSDMILLYPLIFKKM